MIRYRSKLMRHVVITLFAPFRSVMPNRNTYGPEPECDRVHVIANSTSKRRMRPTSEHVPGFDISCDDTVSDQI